MTIGARGFSAKLVAVQVIAVRDTLTRNPSIGRRPGILVCGVMLAGLLCTHASAQTSLMPNAPAGVGDIATGRHNKGPEPKPDAAVPDAIPGARARQPVAPATHGAVDLAPDDALFDAINRGDIAAARDALNRGAELDAVNVLGMTPMELSVDLGRNDISFLLLSMRGEDSGRGARSVGREAPVAPAGKPVVTARRTTGKPSNVARRAPVAVAAKPVARPKLFANDGGTPLPNAGFLGFDAHSASN